MTKKDLLRIPDYLEHILEAIKRIFEYLEDVDESLFLSNSDVYSEIKALSS